MLITSDYSRQDVTKLIFLRESVAYPVLISAGTPPPTQNSAGGRAVKGFFSRRDILEAKTTLGIPTFAIKVFRVPRRNSYFLWLKFFLNHMISFEIEDYKLYLIS